MKFQNSNMLILRRTLYVIMIIFTAVFQSSKGVVPELFGVNAMVLIPAVVSIACFEKSVPSLMLGAFAGIMWDMYSLSTDGFFSVLLTAIGFFTAMIILFYMRNNIATAFILSFVSAFCCNTLYWASFVLLRGYGSAVYIYVRYYLPSSIYSAVFVFVFYYIVKWVYEKTSPQKKRINY